MTSSDHPTEATSLLAAFATSWNGHDAEALAAIFTADGDYVDFSGHWLQGHVQIRDAHQFVLEGPLAGSHIRFTDHATKALSDHTFVIHTHWELINIPHAIDATGTRRGVITFTCVDENGQAVIAAGQNTLIVDSDPFGNN